MSMLTLNGTVLNVFEMPPYTDKKTGEINPAKSRVQIMAENTLQNGQNRMDLVTLGVDNPEAYQRLVGRSVRVPVGAFVNGSAIQYYALKGQTPEATEARAPAGSGAQPAARASGASA